MAHTMCHLTRFCSLWYKNQSTHQEKKKETTTQTNKISYFKLLKSHKALTPPILTCRYCTTVPFCLPAASCFPFGLQHTRQKKKKRISLALRNWRVTKLHKTRTNKWNMLFFSTEKKIMNLNQTRIHPVTKKARLCRSKPNRWWCLFACFPGNESSLRQHEPQVGTFDNSTDWAATINWERVIPLWHIFWVSVFKFFPLVKNFKKAPPETSNLCLYTSQSVSAL